MTLWTVAHQAPLSVGFPRQEYWSGLPFPSPGDLPDKRLNPGLLHCRQILGHLNHQGNPIQFNYNFVRKLIWCLYINYFLIYTGTRLRNVPVLFNDTETNLAGMYGKVRKAASSIDQFR